MKHRMKWFGVFGLFMSLTASATVHKVPAAEGGHTGNGGGGIIRNGEYLTFSSAKVHLSMVELESLPGLSVLEDAIVKMTDLDNYSKSSLYGAVAPSQSRHYYVIDQISPLEKQRLLAIYRNIVQDRPTDNTVIFAVTDTATRETYILPEFFKLRTDEERAQNLFHESLWLFGPVDANSYQKVVRTELAFADFLTNQNNHNDLYPLKLYEGLGLISGGGGVIFVSAINYDLRHHFLSAHDSNGSINGYAISFARVDLGSFRNVTSSIQYYAALQAREHPEMMIYQALSRSPDSFQADVFLDRDGRVFCGFSTYGIRAKGFEDLRDIR